MFCKAFGFNILEFCTFKPALLSQAKKSNGAIVLRNYNLFKIEESKSKTEVGCLENTVLLFVSNLILRFGSPGKYHEALQKSPR